MAGSGVFVDRQGLVLTAAHVISGKRTGVHVVDGAGQEFIAEVLAVDDGHDVAILAANGARPASWLKLADRAPRLGERIFLVGSPLYRHGTVTPGWVARN
ncbi:MAG: serine protease, partial [Planctomycetota bacterium]